MKRTHIGRHSLEFLREHYRNYLFKEYLPFWQKFGIDHELGGFMCGIDHDGNRTDDSKLMWYQGRGLWTYSYLYRFFGGDENLQVATKAKDFLLENGRDKDGNWVQCLSRKGRIESPATGRGYAPLFVAEGMQAYSHATGDQEALDVSLEALEQGLRPIVFVNKVDRARVEPETAVNKVLDLFLLFLTFKTISTPRNQDS